MGGMLQAMEGKIMRRFLHLLRRQRPVFSHALVHDAIFIENDIPMEFVLKTYSCAATEFEMPTLRIAAKPWDVAKAKLDEVIEEAGYHPKKQIEWPTVQLTTNEVIRRRPMWNY